MKRQYGLIAILDALGAATYSPEGISDFVEGRALVIDALEKAVKSKVERRKLNVRKLTTFTFNDTVIIVYRTDREPSAIDARGFFLLLRQFQVNSLLTGILFRGSVSLGEFYVNGRSNTVMGPTVSDAAAWYDKSEWVGIHATPYATLLIEALAEPLKRQDVEVESVMVNYPVPMKDGTKPGLLALNWPKLFVTPRISPVPNVEDARSVCVTHLMRQGVPKGTEAKFFNTMDFFDHCAKRREAAAAAEAAEAAKKAQAKQVTVAVEPT